MGSHGRDDSTRQVRHGLAGLERRQPVSDKLPLELAGLVAKSRARARQHGGPVTVGPPPQGRLGDHTAHGVPDQHRPSEAQALNRGFHVRGESLEIHVIDRGPLAVTR
jgi:hypothetical protein